MRAEWSEGGQAGASPARAVALLAVIILAAAACAPGASGQTGVRTGSVLFAFGSKLSDNESNYTLHYSVPDVIQAGAAFNMTFYVYVTVLSGWKIQSQTQDMQIVINTPTKQVTTQESKNEVTLFQGGRWGPFNMTFELNDAQAGISPGQRVNATIFADLTVYEAYDNPAAPFVQDAGATQELATVQIQGTPSQGPSQGRLLASIAIGAAVMSVLAAGVLAVQRRNGPSAQKAEMQGAALDPVPSMPRRGRQRSPGSARRFWA